MERSFLVALVVSGALGPPLLLLLRAHGPRDVPGPRSAHSVPMPRAGGLALLVGVAAGVGVAEPGGGPALVGLLWATAGFAMIGFADDLRPIRPATRLCLQALVASVAAVWLLDSLTGAPIWQIAFAGGSVLWLMTFVNVFNFMDGIDGLSAIEAIVAGTTWLIVANSYDVDVVSVAGAALAGAALGFLPLNFPRARVFLGDVGSYGVGAFMAATVLIGVRAGIPPIAMFAPVAVYLADTGTTIVRRICRRAPITEAHRDHTYQRIADAGYRPVLVTLIVGTFAALCATLGAGITPGSTAGQVMVGAGIVGICAAYLWLPRALGHWERARSSGQLRPTAEASSGDRAPSPNGNGDGNDSRRYRITIRPEE